MAARPGEMAETPPREAPALGSAAAAAASFARRMARTGRVSATARGKLASGGAPAYEAERLGGDGSVRGYESGELGAGLATLSGSVSLVLPLPARVPGGPPPPVSFVLFADAGARDEALAGRKPSSSQPLASGASVGYGLRFGPIRFDVAHNARGERMTHVGLVGDEFG
mmetsp:Transcript_7079/g.22275  ORF Transcript_7079/g.22275 Transcript_7079/m.22275 type:complete len:169 (+) Transcript_7079:150-656(+)